MASGDLIRATSGSDWRDGLFAGNGSHGVLAYAPHRNLIAAITNAFTNPSTLQPFNLSTFAYLNDALGRRVEVTRTGAAFGDLSGATDAYGYNGRSEVVSSRRTLADSPVRGFENDYAYDPIGNRTSATDYDEQGNALVSSYSANALNQYTQRTVPGYAAVRGEAATNATVTVNERPVWRNGSYFYGGDEADNTTSNLWKELEVYAAINPPGTNTPDIVSATTGTVFIARTPELFTYDADGNMTSDGRFHYYWNGENRLVCASNAEVVVTYAYDHRGRMVRKEISHRGTEPRRIEYLWDDWNIIREIVREGDTIAITDNVWGLDLDGTLQGAGGVGGLLAVVKSDCAVTNSAFCILHSALYLPTYDANGNISEYVSTNGEVVAHYDYSPFGEPLVASGPLATTFTHQFSTKPYCAVTGFSEYIYRKYRPEIGRWMSRDPVGELFNVSIYMFCINNPAEEVDLLGFLPVRWPSPAMPPDYLPGIPNPDLVIIQPVVPPSWDIDPIFRITPFLPSEDPRFPYYEDCICKQGSRFGRRQRADWDPVNNPVTDKKCTTDIIEAFPGTIGLRFKVFSTLFDSCCKKHDSCYATCNSNKWSCDNAFGSCMESMCRNSLHNILLPHCLVAAEEYKLGVILFGDTYLAGSQSFSNLQNASCEDCCCE